MRKIISYFTLRLIVKNYFTDAISGKAVNLYEDKFGTIFMKDDRWSLFSIEIE